MLHSSKLKTVDVHITDFTSLYSIKDTMEIPVKISLCAICLGIRLCSPLPQPFSKWPQIQHYIHQVQNHCEEKNNKRVLNISIILYSQQLGLDLFISSEICDSS